MTNITRTTSSTSLLKDSLVDNRASGMEAMLGALNLPTCGTSRVGVARWSPRRTMQQYDLEITVVSTMAATMDKRVSKTSLRHAGRQNPYACTPVGFTGGEEEET